MLPDVGVLLQLVEGGRVVHELDRKGQSSMSAHVAADEGLIRAPKSICLQNDLPFKFEDHLPLVLAGRRQVVSPSELAQRHVIQRLVGAEVVNEGMRTEEQICLLLARRLALLSGKGLHIERADVARLILAVVHA